MPIKIQPKKVVGNLRRSQLITTFGTGSIVDMPDYSVIMASTKYWNVKSPVIHEENLERLLNVSGFHVPYTDDSLGDTKGRDIPAMRFPVMHFCPKCGRLMPYWAFGKDEGNKCGTCGRKLVPSRFLVACINGHMEDFPYSWWVHKADFSNCPYNKKRDNLTIEFSDSTGGLDSIVIKCTTCGAKRTMAGCMNPDALRGYHCNGIKPWYYRDDPEYREAADCNASMRGLQRGASNVYFSVTASALTVPPASKRINQEIAAKWDLIKGLLNMNPEDAVLDGMLLATFNESLIAPGLASLDEIRDLVRKRVAADQIDEEYTQQKLLEDEYKIFCNGNYSEDDDLQFRTEQAEIPDRLDDYLEDVVLVKRLREVMALRGFTRISPDKPDPTLDKFQGVYDRDYVPLAEPVPNWLPGIEMKGEGLFIRLKESAVAEWEAANEHEYEAMYHRMQNSIVRCQNFSPRYVLIHTLAHLLIRQLTVECGYSGAAIKERIYSTYPESDKEMCGILLYTSTSDSDGSLGGLVRQGEPDSLGRIFWNMLQEASWCSSDPVCIESKAQGLDSLNYAACHACTLLPETSCVMRNCLLDRASIIGELNKTGRGYFEPLIRHDYI